MKNIIARVLCVLFIISFLYATPRLIKARFSRLDSCVSLLAYPFLLMQHTISPFIYNKLSQGLAPNELTEKYTRLLHEREELIKQAIEFATLQDRLQGVQELQDFKKRYSTSFYVMSDVILRNFSPQEHFFLVDAGSNRSIEKDMVAVYKNCLIGRVTQVYPYYSRITLITDPRCKISAFCPRTHFQGIHQGSARLNLTQVTAAGDNELKKGDLIVSSGEGLVFPKGFGLGKVCEIERENFNYIVTLNPLIDLQKIPYCLLVAKGAEYKHAAPTIADDILLSVPE